MRRTWVMFILSVLAALGLVAATSPLVADSLMTAVFYGIVVVAAGVGAKLLVETRRGAARATANWSVEREWARFAAANTLPMAFVVVAAIGTLRAAQGDYETAALCYAALSVMVAYHWVAYGVARRRG